MNKMQIIAGMFGIPASIVSGLVAYYNYDKIIANKGPAIQILNVTLPSSYPGQPTRLNIEFSKLRPCLPKKATLHILDSNGRTIPIEIPWDNSFPVNPKIKALFVITIPDDTPKGPVQSGQVEVFHNQCSDGADPKEPATFPIGEFSIK